MNGAEPSRTPSTHIRITASTTLIATIAAELGGEMVEVTTLLPYAMCPGHFDLTPGHLARLQHTEWLLYHGFEGFLGRLLQKTDASFRSARIAVPGNWLVPDVHAAATTAIADVLSAARPQAREVFARNATRYHAEIAAASQRATPLRRRVTVIPVVAAQMNRTYVAWLGFRVVATLPGATRLSPRALTRTVTAARVAGAQAVLDNRQSAGKVGATVARELAVPLVVLSNFPDVSQPHPYRAVLESNAALVRAAFPVRGAAQAQ